MRKISPAGVKSDFDAQLTAVENFYRAGRQAFSSARDQSTFVEHSLLAAAVIWEGFLSDLFIAYVNRDPARFKQHLETSFNQHLQSSKKPKRVFDRFGTLHFPVHLTKAQVIELADGDGNNITFSKYQDIEDKADRWLSPPKCTEIQGTLNVSKGHHQRTGCSQKSYRSPKPKIS